MIILLLNVVQPANFHHHNTFAARIRTLHSSILLDLLFITFARGLLFDYSKTLLQTLDMLQINFIHRQ